MSTSSEVVQSEGVLLEVDNVERYVGEEEVAGPFKLVVTNKGILNRDEEGSEVEFSFSAVGDFGIDQDGSVYPQACVHVGVDVSKQGGISDDGLRRTLIYKQVKAADDTTADFEEAEIDYDNYSEPCIVEFRFVPQDAEQMDGLYSAVSEGMTAYKNGQENNGEDGEAANEDEEKQDEEKGEEEEQQDE